MNTILSPLRLWQLDILLPTVAINIVQWPNILQLKTTLFSARYFVNISWLFCSKSSPWMPKRNLLCN